MENKMMEINMEQMTQVNAGIGGLMSLWQIVKRVLEGGNENNAPTVVPSRAQ